jgi:hypothetical protein
VLLVAAGLELKEELGAGVQPGTLHGRRPAQGGLLLYEINQAAKVCHASVPPMAIRPICDKSRKAPPQIVAA